MSYDLFEPDVRDCPPGNRSWMWGVVLALFVVVGVTAVLIEGGRTGVELINRVFPVTREVAGRTTSPDGTWIVRGELVDAGAAASTGCQLFAERATTGEERPLVAFPASELEWDGDKPLINWADDQTLEVGGRTVSVGW